MADISSLQLNGSGAVGYKDCLTVWDDYTLIIYMSNSPSYMSPMISRLMFQRYAPTPYDSTFENELMPQAYVLSSKLIQLTKDGKTIQVARKNLKKKV